MNRIVRAALEIQEVCKRENWRFCFIGGVALQRWGQPRATVDADLAILTGIGSEGEIAGALLARFRPRISDAKAFALRNRVLLLRSSSGVPIDASLAATDFEERMFDRASSYRFGEDAELVTCCAEDLIVTKAFAGREQDWIDIHGVVVRQGENVDRELIFRELTPLLELKEDASAAERLRKIFTETV